jgi:UDP-glucose 4-epimerase
MKIVVTGGSGFVGEHVLRRLRAEHDVCNFDLVGSATTAFIEGDILQPSAVARAIHAADVVVHLAAVADVDHAFGEPRKTVAVNVDGTQNVLEAVRLCGRRIRVVHASTVWVYGDIAGERTEQSLLPASAHIYTASKVAAEGLVSSYSRSYGVDSVILRFGIPFGSGGRSSGVIPSMVARALAGESLVVRGSGAQSRQFVPVSDLADAIERVVVATRPSPIYNLAYREPVAVLQIAELVRKFVDPSTLIERLPGRQNDQDGGTVSVDLAFNELGWRPTLPFVEALKLFIDSATQESRRSG